MRPWALLACLIASVACAQTTSGGGGTRANYTAVQTYVGTLNSMACDDSTGKVLDRESDGLRGSLHHLARPAGVLGAAGRL